MMGTEGALRLAGYAAVFDVPDRGRDVVRKGAFAGAGAVPLLWQHDAARPVGVVERAEEDGRGLRISARLADGSEGAREAASLLRAGALSGLSFGYRVRKSRADRARGFRELLAVELIEVSLVTFPMQPLARVFSITHEGVSDGL
ncbi:MAG: HK97 family phage prohead protease [Sphingosinicella sp.]|nr:HK97 family phage prohead protease [Sphingosinicella sp.]